MENSEKLEKLTGLIEIMAENSRRANNILEIEEDAILACKECGAARKEYLGFAGKDDKIARTLQAMANAGEKTVSETGIGCKACKDLRDYTAALVRIKEMQQKYSI